MVLGEKDLELLSAYYEGDLSEKECRILEARLASDKAFLEAATDLWTTAKLLDNYRNRDLLEKMKAWDMDSNEMIVDKKGPKPRMIAFFIVTIISIAALAGYLIWHNNNAGTIKNRVLADNTLIEKGVKKSGMSDLGGGTTGYSLFDEQLFGEAVAKFEEELKKEPGDQIKPYYLGVAYLGDKKAEKAIPLLERNLTNELIDTDECKWNLALCYIRTGATEKALKLLHELAGKAGERQADAVDLIKKL